VFGHKWLKVTEAGRASMTSIFRRVALGSVVLGVAFWLYALYQISQLPVGDGSGFYWIAVVPLTGILAIGMVPALLLAASNRTVAVAAVFGVGGLVLFALLWLQLLSEFAPG